MTDFDPQAYPTTLATGIVRCQECGKSFTARDRAILDVVAEAERVRAEHPPEAEPNGWLDRLARWLVKTR